MPLQDREQYPVKDPLFPVPSRNRSSVVRRWRRQSPSAIFPACPEVPASGLPAVRNTFPDPVPCVLVPWSLLHVFSSDNTPHRISAFFADFRSKTTISAPPPFQTTKKHRDSTRGKVSTTPMESPVLYRVVSSRPSRRIRPASVVDRMYSNLVRIECNRKFEFISDFLLPVILLARFEVRTTPSRLEKPLQMEQHRRFPI